MSEPLSELIRLRVTYRQYQQLSEAAVLAGLTLSEYLRRLLSSAVDLQEQLISIRNSAEMLAKTSQSEAAIMEALFLLRETASTAQLKQAQISLLLSGLTPIK
mgnify:CR=1 FL=1